jgi:hypothetical protein
VNSQIVDLSNDINSFALSKDKLFPNFSNDLKGILMRVSVPFECIWLAEIRHDEQTGKWFSYRGKYNLALNELVNHLNISIEFFPSSEGR